MKKILTLLIMLLLGTNLLFAQSVGINSDGSAPASSAMLDVSSTAKGFLAPRMTAEQKAAITSPATGLLVYQTNAPAGYYYNSGTPASPAWIQLGAASGASQWTTSGSNIYYNTGNVGIGTTSPSRLLSLSGSQSVIRLYNSGTTTWTGLEMLANNGTLLANIGLDDASGRIGINMKSDGTEDFTITQNGNVGIGTTSPTYKLQVQKTSVSTPAFMVGGGYSGGPRIQTYGLDSDPAAWMGLGTDMGGNSYEHSLYFPSLGRLTIGSYDGSTYSTKMSVLVSGNVGIGTTSPANKLDINGATTRLISNSEVYTANIISNTGTGNALTYYDASDGDLGGGDYAHIGQYNDLTLRLLTETNAGNIIMMPKNGSGNVGIGTTSPSYTLHVNGSVAGTSAYNNLSDARLKKDVTTIENGLTQVMALRPVTFNWNKSVNPQLTLDDKNHLGFIAQEVEAVVPQVVSTASDEMKTKSIAYSDLVPVLTKAIQEQQATIEAQQKQIDELTKLVNQLMYKK